MEAEEAGLERAAEQQQETAHMKEQELQRLESARDHDLDDLTCARTVLPLSLAFRSPGSHTCAVSCTQLSTQPDQAPVRVTVLYSSRA